MNDGSNLSKLFASGQFAVSAELGPPKGTDIGVIEKKAAYLKGNVDAVNVTDNQTAVVRMSSIAVAALLVQMGLEPIIQMTCRDRNRLAIQADLLGAWALGIRNVLCLSGDHQSFGNHPTAKNVYDIDSVQLIQMVKGMGDSGQFQCGDPIEGESPAFFVGGAANPFGDPFDFRPLRLGKKAKAGAQFIQTQMIYNVPKFAEYMKRVCDLGLHERVYVMAGVGPIKSLGAARYMASKVPGMDVPDEIVQRMQDAPKEKRQEEGVQICAEIIQQCREIPGVAGVHIMAIEWEETIPDIIQRTGLFPRPTSPE